MVAATVSPSNGTFEFRFSRVNLDTGYLYDGCDRGRALTGSFDGSLLDLSCKRFRVPEIKMARACSCTRVVVVPRDPNRPLWGIQAKEEVVQKLTKLVNSAVSRLQADQKKLRLLAKGEKACRFEVCPYCSCTIDLTKFPESPQVFCTYCFSMFHTCLPNSAAAEGMDLCQRCGLFDKRKWLIYYVAEVNSGKSTTAYTIHTIPTALLCQTCLKKEARTTLFAGILSLIFLPFAIWDYKRTVKTPEMPPNLEKLKEANRLVLKRKPNKIRRGQEIYQEILAKTTHNAGVRTSLAQTYLFGGDHSSAIAALEAALEDCSNYVPAAKLLVHLYDIVGGKVEERNELETRFGQAF